MTETRDGEGSRFGVLLELAKAGDRGAWQELFSRLANEREEEGAAVLALARKALPRDHWARNLVESRDIVQSALRVGWLNASRFEGGTEAEFFAWLRAILRNKVHRATRRRDARAERSRDDLEDGREARDPLAPMIEEEVRSRVLSALDRLPEDQRSVMDLRLQGLKTEEIGRLLGLKPAAVRKRESRAVARLRELLGPGSRR